MLSKLFRVVKLSSLYWLLWNCGASAHMKRKLVPLHLLHPWRGTCYDLGEESMGDTAGGDEVTKEHVSTILSLR